MALLDPTLEASEKRRHWVFVAFVLALIAVVALYFVFRYYPEQRAAQKFFDTLASGDSKAAYQLWHPQPSYRMQDFLTDWGPNGYYGPVKTYKIIRITAPRDSKNSVALEVALSPYLPMPDASDGEKSRKTRVVTIWMNTDDKSLSFPPF
jgi:hypothetical protein